VAITGARIAAAARQRATRVAGRTRIAAAPIRSVATAARIDRRLSAGGAHASTADCSAINLHAPDFSAALCRMRGHSNETPISSGRIGAMAGILLVEDDPDVRPLLEHILAAEGGYRVSAVGSAASALRLLANQPFDLVLTDVHLPDGSGLVVADDGLRRGMAVLVLTGHGLNLGPSMLSAYDFLLKPVRAAKLLEIVRHRLAHRNYGAEGEGRRSA
jgi:CheY-like chemotaxis protein